MKSYVTPKSVPYYRYSSDLNKIEDLLSVDIKSQFFTMFIAANWNEIDNDSIFEVAEILTKRGLRYICTWGEGCGRAHDIFDEANIKIQLDGASELHVMSTWHDDEILEESLWFWLFCAMVDDEYWDECIGIGISIGNEDWYKIIDDSLLDIDALCAKLDKGEPGDEVIR